MVGRGVGYSVIDPQTGAGAYLIGGGADGAMVKWLNDNADNINIGVFLLGAISMVIPKLAVLAVLATLVFGVLAIIASTIAMNENPDCTGGDIFINAMIQSLALAVSVFVFNDGGAAMAYAITSLVYGKLFAVGLCVAPPPPSDI